MQVDADCYPVRHVGSLSTAREAQREAQPALPSGNCEACSPRRQDRSRPVPLSQAATPASHTAATRWRELPVAAPKPWASCVH